MQSLKKEKRCLIEGCQVPAHVGCLRAVHRRGPGENASHQVKVQGGRGQEARECAETGRAHL